MIKLVPIPTFNLADLLSTVTNLNQLNFAVETSPEGIVRVKSGEISIVKEIAKIPGLRYAMKKEEDSDHYTEYYYVMVTDEIGNLIELYLKSGEFAGLELNEFISKSLE